MTAGPKSRRTAMPSLPHRLPLIAVFLVFGGPGAARADIKLGVSVVEDGKAPRLVIVREVKEDGVAARMGIRIGDLIVRVNERRIDSIDVFLEELRWARTVTVIWKSNGKFYRSTARELVVTNPDPPVEVGAKTEASVNERLPGPGEEKQSSRLGVTYRELQCGALITKVEKGSPAAVARLEAGDIVVSVDGFKVGVVDGQEYSLPSELRRLKGRGVLEVNDRRTGKVTTRDITLPDGPDGAGRPGPGGNREGP
jgi:S1-C subfamily serine protease